MKPSIMKSRTAKRRAMILSQAGLIKEDLLRLDSALPLVIKPVVDGVDLIAWTKSNRGLIEDRILNHGGILFRGFNVSTVSEFEQFMTVLAGELLDYSYRSTPRTQVSGKIYTSTEYPAHQTISLHNEMSYTRQWPMVIGFFCVEPAAEGGETPIADSRKVFNRIDSEIRELFTRKNVMYRRNYGESLDLPWQVVFQTQDRAEVESFCRQAGIKFEWKSDERLRTSQVCQAVASHPRTGEMVWFNQAHLFHVSSLKSEIRESLLASAGGELPRNAFYGDGSPIEDSVLEEIRAAYLNEAIVFPWHRGDILILDNMLTAHGRRPYRGARKIVVGMAQSFGSKAAY